MASWDIVETQSSWTQQDQGSLCDYEKELIPLEYFVLRHHFNSHFIILKRTSPTLMLSVSLAQCGDL